MNTTDDGKNIVICSLCGLIMTTTLSGFVCVNPQCPEYICEKHEHLPERHMNYSGVTDMISSFATGTAISGVTGTYEPINITGLNEKGGESNG